MLRTPGWWRAALLAGFAVVAFDAVASIISKTAGVPYTSFIYGSYLIRLAAGFFGRRAGFTFWSSTLLGTWVGLVDATVGWAVSWWIGPGRVDTPLSTGVYIAIALYVTITATLIGALGAFLGGLKRPSERREA